MSVSFSQNMILNLLSQMNLEGYGPNVFGHSVSWLYTKWIKESGTSALESEDGTLGTWRQISPHCIQEFVVSMREAGVATMLA